MYLPSDMSEVEEQLAICSKSGRELDVRFKGPESRSIRAEVISALICKTGEDSSSTAALRVRGANVVGALNLGSQELQGPLALRDCNLGNLILAKTKADNIVLRGSRLASVSARGLQVENTLNIGQGFRCSGRVMLIGAQIGSLEATWGNFLAGTGEAFNADYITVVKNAYLEGARIKGALRMIGASIGGQLDCTDLRVDGADEEDAFLADSVKVADSLMLAGAFISGNTWLLGSQIGGQLNAVGALLMSLEGTSLNAAGISVEGTVDLQGAYIYGTTSFSGAHVQGEMNFKGSRLFAIGEGDAVDLSTCSVGRTIYFDPLEVSGRLNLTDAKVQTWDDLGGQKPEELSLVGFTYDFINVRAMGTRERVNWLRLQRNYSPQPYAQLISTLRKMGDDRAADRVGISSQWTRRRQPTGWRRTPSILWSALLASLIGFGYAPARALWWFAGLLTVGAYGAHMLARLHQLVPRGTSGTAPFNPVRYTVDLLFPIAQLREADDYVAIGAWAWFPFSYQLIGWLLGAIFVAGLTGVFRRS